MLPYRQVVEIAKPRQDKVKPIPALDFMNVLSTLCEGSPNTYDRKNHILTVNDLNSLQNCLLEKYDRGLGSFEKQLRILGYRLRKFAKGEGEEDMS